MITYPEPRRLKLGLGNLFFNGVFVGELKGSVVFNVNREMAYGQSGNMINPVKAVCTNEEVTLEAEICDLKLSQLRTALGMNNILDSASAVLVKKVEQITLNATTAATLSETPSGTIKVFKLDRSVTYALTTDYTVSGADVTRVALGTITDGETVAVEYTYSETTNETIYGGGEISSITPYQLDFVHEDTGGKSIQITLYKAVATPEIGLSFNDVASGDYTGHKITFRGLADTTKALGKQVYRITEES